MLLLSLARNKVTRAVEELMEGEAEKLTRKAIEKALGGDLVAIKLCLDRIAPPRKDRPISLDLPPMEKPQDAVSSVAAIVGAVADGELSASEAGDLAKLIEAFIRTLTATEIEERLKALEGKGK
jgi:hypothetical protein